MTYLSYPCTFLFSIASMNVLSTSSIFKTRGLWREQNLLVGSGVLVHPDLMGHFNPVYSMSPVSVAAQTEW